MPTWVNTTQMYLQTVQHPSQRDAESALQLCQGTVIACGVCRRRLPIKESCIPLGLQSQLHRQCAGHTFSLYDKKQHLGNLKWALCPNLQPLNSPLIRRALLHIRSIYEKGKHEVE